MYAINLINDFHLGHKSSNLVPSEHISRLKREKGETTFAKRSLFRSSTDRAGSSLIDNWRNLLAFDEISLRSYEQP